MVSGMGYKRCGWPGAFRSVPIWTAKMMDKKAVALALFFGTIVCSADAYKYYWKR